MKTYIKKYGTKISSLESIEENWTDFFLPLESLGNLSRKHRPKDEFYVEGAIVIQQGGNTIMGFRHWDLVDQLWVLLCDATLKLKESPTAEFYFPDQPLLVTLKRFESKVRLKVGDQPSSVFGWVSFTSQALEEAISCLTILKRFFNSNAFDYDIDRLKPELQNLLK